jgi:uracil-DNA glycosylase
VTTDARKWLPDRPTVRRLAAAAADCRGCELWQDATQVVFSAGPAKARLALVGEQPGDQEDRDEAFEALVADLRVAADR